MPKAKPLPDQTYMRECFDYDPITGVLTWKARPQSHFASIRVFHMWNTSFSGRFAGTRTKGGHYKVFLDNRQILVHRLIWKWMTGNDPYPEVDHDDQNGTNNIWGNLRKADRVGNGMNRSKSKTKHDGLPKGVRATGRRFRAVVVARGVRVPLGLFATPEAAHEAYVAGALQYHGAFANYGSRQQIADSYVRTLRVVATEADVKGTTP